MREYTQKELKEILKRHKMWIEGKRGGKQANLSDTSLYCEILSNTPLMWANFNRANLCNAILYSAKAMKANFQGADLRGADLRDGIFREANFQGADLRGAYVTGADLRWANLTDTKLQGAILQGAYLPDGFYQVIGAGSVQRCTIYDSVNDQIICGCWDNNAGNHLEAFKQRINDIYGNSGEKPNKNYYIQYMTAIAFFEVMRETNCQRKR